MDIHDVYNILVFINDYLAKLKIELEPDFIFYQIPDDRIRKELFKYNFVNNAIPEENVPLSSILPV